MRSGFLFPLAVAILLLLSTSSVSAQTPQEHVHQMSHSVMPFAMSETVHIFKMTESGGVLRVIAKDAGATVVLVAPPVSAPQSAAVRDIPYMLAFKAMSERIARRHDLTLVWGYDPWIASEVPYRGYFDAEHMCAAAARRFSSIVAEHLVAAGVLEAQRNPPEIPADAAPHCEPRN